MTQPPMIFADHESPKQITGFNTVSSTGAGITIFVEAARWPDSVPGEIKTIGKGCGPAVLPMIEFHR